MKTIKTAYKYYKKKYKDDFKSTPSMNLTWQEFRDINYSFNKKVVNKALNGYSVSLPHSMGELRIRKKKINPERLAPDWGKTNKARKINPDAPMIYHMNFHSDGYKAHWKCKRFLRRVRGMGHYIFESADGNNGRSPRERLTKIMLTEGGHKRFNEW